MATLPRKALILMMLAGLLSCVAAHGWGSDDMEVFDLVEEVNENFYTLMQINPNATNQEIKRAFRTLSVQLHPDKNDAEDANIKFRNMVAVYEVLKDAGKREKYDRVLKEGLPNWKSALYYYRRMRKVGMAECMGILLLIITVIQYITAWAAYAEKKYTAEQIIGSKLKKLQKTNKTNVDIDTILNEIPTPSIWNTLPFQIPMGIYRTVVGTPGAIKSAMNFYAEQKKAEEERRQMEKEEEELLRKQEEERAKLKEDRNLRKRNKKFVAPEKTDEELAAYTQSIIKQNSTANEQSKAKPIVTGGLWTEDDLNELVRLVKKYPGGTTDRWEIIAEMMGRAVSEVTYMSAKMKEGAYKVSSQTDSIAESIMQEAAAKQKIKTKKTEPAAAGTGAEANSNWSQEQQAALESAIQKYPKSGSSDRWQKIANSVPGKTKEECMARYKYLVELVKKQKEEKEREAATAAAAAAAAEANECPVEDEPVVEERIEESKSKPKGKKGRKQEAAADAVEDDDGEQAVADKQQSGGKAKNKRRERKKAIEYYSYEDSEDGSEQGEI